LVSHVNPSLLAMAPATQVLYRYLTQSGWEKN
jgi:hypothetical protein